MSGTPIWERYGLSAVNRMVSSFYRAVLESERLGQYFDGAPIRALVDHQSAFMMATMGGPTSHTDAEIEAAHRHLKISKADFDLMIELLRRTMEEFGFAAEDIENAIAGYTRLQAAVVTNAH